MCLPQTNQGTIPPVGAPNSPFSAGPFLRTLNSAGKTIPASSFNFTAGQQYIITSTVSLQGQLRCAQLHLAIYLLFVVAFLMATPDVFCGVLDMM